LSKGAHVDEDRVDTLSLAGTGIGIGIGISGFQRREGLLDTDPPPSLPACQQIDQNQARNG
jgi:hypothetical protein